MKCTITGRAQRSSFRFETGGSGAAATFRRPVCFRGVKNLLIIFLKVIVAIAIGVAIVHLWPVTIVPMFVALLLLIGLAALFLICLVTVGTAGVAMLAVLLALAAGLLALLSPVWILVVLILGIIWVVRRLCGIGRRSAAA